MATPSEVRLKQRAVIEFLVAKGETTVNIHKRLRTVYKDNTLDYSIVWRWAHLLMIVRVRPNFEMNKVLLQHDNAQPHTSIRTREAITSFGWTILLHPPY